MTEEHKRKIGLANAISLKGKHCSQLTEFKKGLIPWNKGKIFPELREENSPYWKGGTLVITRKILKRRDIDLTTCKICKEKPNRIMIHHINGNQRDNKVKNLVPLCYFCHNAIHDTPSKINNRFQIGHKPYQHF